VIKINLLAVDRERAKRKAKFQIGQKITVACSLILVVAALGIGWWYWYLQSASADLDRQITDAQAERGRLQNVIQQVQQFEAQKAQQQQRVTLIEQLRKGQTGPVHLLDQVSRALPDTMWLTSLTQKVNEVLIEGRCTSLTSLSDFVAALGTSNLFERPVEIVDSQVESTATPGAAELIRFSVRARVAEKAN
jgi:type IV pilus assembly protein PilN